MALRAIKGDENRRLRRAPPAFCIAPKQSRDRQEAVANLPLILSGVPSSLPVGFSTVQPPFSRPPLMENRSGSQRERCLPERLVSVSPVRLDSVDAQTLRPGR
jgi:hypothetical protein